MGRTTSTGGTCTGPMIGLTKVFGNQGPRYDKASEVLAGIGTKVRGTGGAKGGDKIIELKTGTLAAGNVTCGG